MNEGAYDDPETKESACPASTTMHLEWKHPEASMEFFRRLVVLRECRRYCGGDALAKKGFHTTTTTTTTRPLLLQETVQGETVQHLHELYEAAERIRPQLQQLLNRLGPEQVNVSWVVAALKGRDRASEKARVKYSPNSRSGSLVVVGGGGAARKDSNIEQLQGNDNIHDDDDDVDDFAKENAGGAKENAGGAKENAGADAKENAGGDDDNDVHVAVDDKNEGPCHDNNDNDDDDGDKRKAEEGSILPRSQQEATASKNSEIHPTEEKAPPPVALLHDIVRASIVCSSEEDIVKVLDWLVKQDAQVVQIKNRFSSPHPFSGYRDLLVKLVVRSEDEKFCHVCEIQIHHAQVKEELDPTSLELYQYFRNYFAGMEKEAEAAAVQELLDVLELSSLVSEEDSDDCSLESQKEDEETSLVMALVEKRSPFVASFLETQLHEYPLALALREQLGIAMMEEYGEISLQAAAAHFAIGNVCLLAGDYQMALRSFWKALRLRESLSSTKLDLLEAYHHVALVFEKMGNGERALALYQKTLEISVPTNQAAALLLAATSHCRLAGLLAKKQDYDGALQELQQAIAIQEDVLGEFHLETALSYNTVGVLLVIRQENARGLTFLQRALAVRLDFWGLHHVHVAESYSNIGGAQSNLGNYPEALACFQKALEVQHAVQAAGGNACHKKDKNKKNADVSKTYYNKGLVYKRMGQYEAAVVEYRNALELRELVLGVDHPDTNAMREALRLLCHERGAALRAAVARLETDEHGQPQEGVTYLILHPPSGKVLDVYANRTENGSNVHLWEPNGRTSQMWRVQRVGQKFEMAICNVPSNKVLDVKRGGTRNGSNVQLHEDHGGANQRWTYRRDGLLINTKSGKALDRRFGATSNGTNIHIWSICPQNHAQQEWRFVAVD